MQVLPEQGDLLRRFADRVEFMYEHYGPLITEIIDKFRGQGTSIDRVFERSLAEQAALISPATRDRLLAYAAVVKPAADSGSGDAEVQRLQVPIGLHVQDPQVRRREAAVKRLLQRGVLRTERIIETLLTVRPEAYLADDEASAMLTDALPASEREGALQSIFRYKICLITK